MSHRVFCGLELSLSLHKSCLITVSNELMVLFLNLIHYSYLIFPIMCFLYYLRIFSLSIKGQTTNRVDKTHKKCKA